jgi:hypothetical protein
MRNPPAEPVPSTPSRHALLVVVYGIDLVDVLDFARLLNPAMKRHLKTTFTAQYRKSVRTTE